MNWFGHVVRRGDESYVKKSYKNEFANKRPSGRPPKRWRDLVREDVGLPLLTAERIAKDRSKWRSLVESKCARISKGLRI